QICPVAVNIHIPQKEACREGLLQKWNASGQIEPCKADQGLMAGLNCYDGMCTFPGVAEALNLEYVLPSTFL
ncbi:MAG: hypothetical protein AAGU02_05775, partial [Lawsonibacter sp.]